MGACSQTSCGKAAIEYGLLREMNKRGVYTPEQINSAVEKYWKSYSNGDTFIDKDRCRKVVKKSVGAIGTLGNGMSMNETQFEGVYKAIDKMGLGKIAQAMCLAMVTKHIADVKPSS